MRGRLLRRLRSVRVALLAGVVGGLGRVGRLGGVRGAALAGAVPAPLLRAGGLSRGVRVVGNAASLAEVPVVSTGARGTRRRGRSLGRTSVRQAAGAGGVPELV